MDTPACVCWLEKEHLHPTYLSSLKNMSMILEGQRKVRSEMIGGMGMKHGLGHFAGFVSRYGLAAF